MDDRPATAEILPPLAARPPWLERVAGDPAYAWAVRGWEIAAAQPGAWFDAVKADRVVEAWPRWFKLTSERFAGQPFYLSRWQEIIVRMMVGWKRPSKHEDPRDGSPIFYQVRVFRRLFLWIARKNGKSEFLAALALLFFIYERVIGAQGYCFARDEDQARISFGRMKAMLASDERLTGGATPRVQTVSRAIYVAETSSSFVLLTGKADGKHGRMPQVILGDEMHEWESLDLMETLHQGTGTLLQPVELYASTAGIKSKKIGFGLWEEALAIVEGQSDDPATLACVFAAHPDADWKDEAVWRVANPTIGVTPTWDYLRAEARAARNNPRAEAAFRRYHLNQWVEQVQRWLPAELWDGCAPDAEAWRTRLQDMKGRRCVGAFDISAKLDITALVWRFEPEEAGGPVKLACRFWVPEDTLAARAEADRKTPWREWARSGAIETTPGNAVDQNFIGKAVKQGLEDYEVALLGFDPWNAVKLIGDLTTQDGVDPELCREVRQGIHSLGEASKAFEHLVYSGRLDHGGHPVLAWMARNAAIRFDENMNFMPAKKRSADKIDGIVSAVMAEALTLAETEAAPVSPWDDPEYRMAKA